MPSPEYSLTDTLERIYENQLALEATDTDREFALIKHAP